MQMIAGKNEILIFLKLGLVASVILLMVSPDSFTHDMFGRCDSSTFFMCGKAWMEGLLPYRDFADSKGLLLWLIYGIGYLLSPHDYLGVLVVSCLWYSFIFYFIFLTARVFLKDDRWAFLAAVLQGFFFFDPYIHYEVRAEDFAMLMIVASLYFTVRHLYGSQCDKDLLQSCFAIGFLMGALFLIKFNIIMMAAIFPFFLLIAFVRSFSRLIAMLGAMLGGFLIILLPFALYVMWQGIGGDFVREYIVNTMLTVNRHASYLGEVFRTKFLLESQFIKGPGLLWVSLSGALLLIPLLKRWVYFPLLVCLWFFVLCSMHGVWPYYYGSCLFIPVFGIVAFLLLLKSWGRVEHWLKRTWVMASAGVLSVAGVVAVNYQTQDNHDQLWYVDSQSRQDYYTCLYLVSQVENPTIMYFSILGPSVDLWTHAKPACRYFVSQNGSTAVMDQQQMRVVKYRLADFVVTSVNDIYQDYIESRGYRKYSCKGFGVSLFSKRPLKLPPDDFYMSPTDVLMKRNKSAR